MNYEYLLASIFLVPVAVYRVAAATQKRRTGSTGMAVALSGMSLFCLAKSFAPALDRLSPPNLSFLLWHLSALAGISGVRMLVRAARPDGITHRQVRRLICVGVYVILTYLVLFIVAPKRPGAESLYVDGQLHPVLYVMKVMFNGYMLIGLVDLLRLSLIGARRSGHRATRLGLGIAAVGLCGAVLSGTAGLIRQTLSLWHVDSLGWRWLPALDGVAATAVGFGCLIPPVADLIGRWRTSKRWHSPLQSLWSTLTERIPDVVLPPPNVRTPLGRTEMAIVRYQAEIADALNEVRLTDPGREDWLLAQPDPSLALGGILREPDAWSTDPTGSNSIVALMIADGQALDIRSVADGFQTGGQHADSLA